MAGRIPQYFIDDLLARLDIVDIVDSRVKLKKTGRNYSACCPFHQEKTPSFSVSPEKQFYYCFGCGASGNALGFVMDFDHLDFPTAVDELAGRLGLEVPREQNTHAIKGPDYSDLYQLLEKAAAFFQTQLRQHEASPKAAQYLKHRGLDKQCIETFNIGFSPPGWDNLQTFSNNQGISDKKLIESGLLVKQDDTGRIYDRFRDRLMFPIRDSRGRTIAFGGRILGDGKPKYLNSPETPVFLKGKELYGLYEARKANRSLDQVIVVEGYMDVVALFQQGITNSVATLGTATTADHMRRLFKLVPDVVFCFDGDDAGRRAAWRALESTLPLMEDGRQARFLFLPQGEDPDSIIRQEGAEAFRNRIRQHTLSLDNFLFNALEEGLDLNAMDGRARLTKLAQPYMNQLPEGIFKALILDKLAARTGLDKHQLLSHLSEEPQSFVDSSPAPASPPAGTEHLHRVPADTGAPHYYSSTAAPLYRISPVQPSPQPVSKVSAADYAIRQLISNTSLATGVAAEMITRLKESSSGDCRILVKLLETLRHSPGLSACALISQEYGTTEGQRLLKQVELDLGTQTNEQEFHEALRHIMEKIENEQKQAQLNELKQALASQPLSQMNARQRQQYRKLLQLPVMLRENTEKK